MEAKWLFFALIVVAVMAAVRGRDPNPDAWSKDEQFYKDVYHNMYYRMDKINRQVPPQSADPAAHRQPLNVTVDFTLTSLTRLNKKGGYAEVEGMLTTRYNDPRLVVPDLQAKEATFPAKPQDIWTPDIELYNGVHPGLQVFNSRPTAVISPSGEVTLVNMVSVRFLCDVIGQISQLGGVNCTMKLGSWAHSGLDIVPHTDLTPSGILALYKVASVWNVTSAKAWSGAKKYPCCPEPYPYVQFSFLINKRSRP